MKPRHFELARYVQRVEGTYQAAKILRKFGVPLFLALAALAGNANAQFYGGLAGGISHGTLAAAHDCLECSYYQTDYTHLVFKAFVGYRYKYVGMELGGGDFARYESHAVTARPADVLQTIDTRYRYAKAMLYLPVTEKFSAFVGRGIANTYAHNFERGINCIPGTPVNNTPGGPQCTQSGYVEQRNTVEMRRPLYSIGADYQVSQHFALRFEAERIANFAVSVWTVSSDANAYWLAVRFQ